MADLRALPSVEKLLQTGQASELISLYGRPLTLAVIREVMDDIRSRNSHKYPKLVPLMNDILEMVRNRLVLHTSSSLQPVINATGVILHTNLGRAPLSANSIEAMESVANGYSSLEFDLLTGKRGSRSNHAEEILKQLLGTEAAYVVNNNAAAVLLVLSALANRKSVIISRTQLVEIGGGFRVPDVMKQSGARLIEIGTTNQVHLSDYQLALQEPVNLVMHAHRSNFKMIGFTSEPELSDIVLAAHSAGVPFLDDLGSGALLETEKFGLAHEPTVQESLAAGADLVCFSGDKLVGGPQAGIIVGNAKLIGKIKKHPLGRAVRADKLCLAALSATLLHYLKNQAERTVPTWQMISTPVTKIKARAKLWAKTIGEGEVVPGFSTVGGGSLPGETLPTWLLALDAGNPDKFLAILRNQKPPIIGRTENDRVLLDPRTVSYESELFFLDGLRKALKS